MCLLKEVTIPMSALSAPTLCDVSLQADDRVDNSCSLLMPFVVPGSALKIIRDDVRSLKIYINRCTDVSGRVLSQ